MSDFEIEWLPKKQQLEKDRRQFPRYAVDLPGSIVCLAPGALVPLHIPVRLESISRSGGRLRLLDPSVDLENLGHCKLLMIYHDSQKGQLYRTQIAWNRDNRVGIEFVARASVLEPGMRAPASHDTGNRDSGDRDTGDEAKRILESLQRVKQVADSDRTDTSGARSIISIML